MAEPERQFDLARNFSFSQNAGCILHLSALGRLLKELSAPAAHILPKNLYPISFLNLSCIILDLCYLLLSV
jgi:hypothetical protein